MRLITSFLLWSIIVSSLVNCSHIHCCEEAGVPHHCAKSLCNLNSPPGDLDRYALFEGKKSCAKYLPEISTCLADGRDSTACCVKDAESPEDSACFGICNGTMEHDTSKSIANFQSCYSLNIDSMFSCIKSSHGTNPSEPRELQISEQSENSVVLKWEAPSKKSDHVRFYSVHAVESREKQNIQVTYETEEQQMTISDLNLQSTYSFFVVAYGRKHHGDSGYHKSTPSNIIHFTLAENIIVFNKSIQLPKHANSVQLSCHLKVLHGTKPSVEWEKVTINGAKVIDSSQERFKINQYSSETTPQFMVSSLEIKDIQPSDFTVFRCYIKGQSKEFGQIEIQSHSYSDSPPVQNPPQTVEECCLDAIKTPHCQSFCNLNPLRRSNFAPIARCMTEFHSLFKCTLTQMNNAACCIKSKLPYECLGLCDGSYDLNFLEMTTCLTYIDQVHQCQAETLNLRPEPVSDINNTYDSYNEVYTFTWPPSNGVKIYHIYKRLDDGEWISDVENSTKYTAGNINEIVFLAVNDYGVSTQNRLKLIDDKWIIPR